MRIRLAALLATLVLVPVAAGDWAAFHNDALGTGTVPSSTYPVYQDVWWNNKTLANQQIYASPVVKDNIVVVADRSGLVRGLDGESGHELWNRTMPAGVEGTPAIAGERVYVVDTAGNLKALNLRDGRVETTATAPVGATFGSVREHQGKLFIGNDAGQLKAYYSLTLTLLWTFDLANVYASHHVSGAAPNQVDLCDTNDQPVSAQPIRGAPAVFGGRVFFGSFNHYVFAVDEDGLGNGKTTVHWMYKTGDIVADSPSIGIVDQDTYRVFVGSYDGKLYAFNGAEAPDAGTCNQGNGLWTDPITTVWDPFTVQTGTERKIESSPATDGTRIYFGANNGHVYALYAADGTLAWDQAGTGSSVDPVTSSPAVANGIVVVGSRNKNVYWLSATDGHVLKTPFAAQGAMGTSPAIEGDKVYIASTDGITYMFGPKVPPRPDLVIGNITATPNSITVAVKNVGTASAGASKVRILLDGTLISEQDVGALDPGKNVTITYTGAIAAGNHKVTAIADFGAPDAVKESNESNNSKTEAIGVGLPPPPPPVVKPTTTTTSGKGKIPSWTAAAPIALVGIALLLRRRIR